MRKKIFFILVSFIFCSNAFVLANYLDANFTGDTLVVGGITKNHPDRLSINLYNADIIGSGWDTELLNQLTLNKYNHVLFEHVGMSLYHVDRDGDFSFGVAKAYYNLLKSGGSFDFLSWGYFFDDLHRGVLGLCFNLKCCPGLILSYDLEKHIFDLAPESSSLSDAMKNKLLEEVKNNPYISATIYDLVNAGFIDIKIKREEDGVLGFTRSHDSLHISARKPMD